MPLVGRDSGTNMTYHTDLPVFGQLDVKDFDDFEVREIEICGEYQRVSGLSIQLDSRKTRDKEGKYQI